MDLVLLDGKDFDVPGCCGFSGKLKEFLLVAIFDVLMKLYLLILYTSENVSHITFLFIVNSDHWSIKDQSFTISHIFDSNQPLPFPNFENQEGHNNPGDDMRGAGPVSQISSAGVHIVLPDTSTVLTMLFLLTAEASPNYLQRMPQLRKVAPLQRSNVVAKSAVLYSIQIESGLTTTLLSNLLKFP
ncbi:hypothetical protein Bca4012_071270 [Brassica carinata]